MVIVRNGESTVQACLESLLAQTSKCEIVVVDGNSTDTTRDIVQRFPVKLVRAPREDSYGISRNLGVRSASGEVILFMDADDYCGETWAETLLNDFEEPGVGIVTVPRKPTSLDGWFMRVLGAEFELRDVGGKSEEMKRLADWTSVTTKGTAWLKRAIVEAGGFDGAMFFGTEDKDLAYRICNLGYKVVTDPQAAITATPVGGALNFVKDKYWRAGVGHGYFRRKHGVYRPPLGGVGSFVLLVASGALVSLSQPLLGLGAIVLAVVILAPLWREGLALRAGGSPFFPTIGFLVVKWVSRLAEFTGFLRGYLLFQKPKTRGPSVPRGNASNHGQSEESFLRAGLPEE